MSVPRWNPPVPDHQMIVEAQLEDTMRSVVEWRDIPGTGSRVGLDKDGDVLVMGCGGRRDPDPTRVAQDQMETGSQVVGAVDDWA